MSTDPSVHIREHRPGDIGWVLQRHGELYHEGYGFNHVFEAMVGKILVDFRLGREPERERLWIAEKNGQRLGSVMLVAEGENRKTTRTCRLRLFLVEPDARGLGLGTRLMDTLFAFAREQGYERMVLSTVDALKAARRIYERAGFELVDTFGHRDWSVPVTEEEWSLDL